MGHLIRSFDWSENPLGSVENWPQSLRTTLNLILSSCSPLFLLWGPELICFYNDAYRPSLENAGKHPGALGRKFETVWPESWPAIQPLIDQVRTTGEATRSDQPYFPGQPKGGQDGSFRTFSYSPAYDDEGQINGVLVTCTETMTSGSGRKKLEESERFLRQLTETMPAILWITEPDGYCSYLNRQWYEFTGQSNEEAEGFGWLDATHPDDQEKTGACFIEANERQIPFSALYRLRHKEGTYRWVVDKGSPRFDEQGNYQGMIGTVVDVHDQKLAEEEKQKLIAILEASPEFIGLAASDTSIEYANPAALEMLGWDTVDGKKIQDYIFPEDWAIAEKILPSLVKTGHFSHEIRFVNAKSGKPFWLEWNAVTLKDPVSNQITGLATVSPNITSRKNTEQSLRESEARFRRLIAEAPIAMAVYSTRNLIIETANDAMITLWGKTPSVIGMKLAEALPELEGQPFIGLLEQVFDTGIPYQSAEQSANLVVNGQLQTFWFTFTYQPLTTDQGQVYAILNVAVDVTERVAVRQRIEENRQQLLESFEQSPVAIAIIDIIDLRFRMANPLYGQLVGRQPGELIGKSFLEVLPELQGQGFDQLIEEVGSTGSPYVARETEVTIFRNNQLESIYVDLTIQPQYETRQGDGSEPDSATRISGVMVVAIDVTQQVLARQKVEEAESTLRGAIELAELSTWSMDIETGRFTYSDRFMNWLGFSEHTKSMDEAYNPLPDDYRQSVAAAINAVVQPGASGSYRNEHPIVNRLTGQVRIIDAQGKVFVDAQGKPVKLVGTAQDITEQRKIQLALEQQVQIRTEELETANEELAATNEELSATIEELATTNEELAESNQLLIRSNENLEQFAYIASHDLQEPLRKVRQFGDLLKNHYTAQLGDGVNYLDRMQLAAGRMSALIKDLLTFSRISMQQDTIEPVSLTEVVNTVLTDLDLAIQESGAVVTVEPLPTVPGDASQLEQLFQNLLSNALKFRRTDKAGVPVAPLIHVGVRMIADTDLPPSVKPARSAGAYYCLYVSDNGIGFDQKYVDRIFQVFQRLHGKSEFAGTGIGLAICEKVASNHGGAISATSQPGQGATFSVYLPVL
ncbi:hypothetical protein GCM10028803_07430 [Larkinella knui]